MPCAFRALALYALSCFSGGTSAAAQALPDTSGWSPLAGSRVTVWYRGDQQGVGELVLRFLDEQPPLPALPGEVPAAVSAFLAPDSETFDALTGGRIPDWGAGVAIPSLALMVLPVYASGTFGGDRERVLRHEWAHLGLHQAVGGLRVPRWFDEGYAGWAAGWDRSEAWRLRILLASGRSPPLDSLTLDWPRDAASARVAYLLAATAVEYLVSESGERGLALFLDRWSRSGSFDGAMLATYGVTQGQFETHWRAYLKRRYGWLLVFSQSMVVWGFLALLLILMLGVRRRRDRERLARLRAGEFPDTPEWWGENDPQQPGGPVS